MDEKNANGEINANESVKQLSDGNAQSVESEAEAREFDVVTEKPAQRQEKKTKNAAKRPSGKQRSETTQVVTKTAVRTLVVLVAALILIFAFYILVFPASSGSFGLRPAPQKRAARWTTITLPFCAPLTQRIGR